MNMILKLVQVFRAPISYTIFINSATHSEYAIISENGTLKLCIYIPRINTFHNLHHPFHGPINFPTILVVFVPTKCNFI